MNEENRDSNNIEITEPKAETAKKRPARTISLDFSKFNFVDSLPAILMVALLVLTPVVIFPYGENLFKHSKIFFTIFISLLMVATYAFSLLRRKVVSVVVSPFLLPVLLLLISSVASTLFTNTYPTTQLVGFGGAYIALALLALIAPTLLHSKQIQTFSLGVSIAGALVSVTSLLEVMGYGPSLLLSRVLGITIPAQSFSVTGSFFVAAQFLLVAGVATILSLAKRSKFKVWYLFSLIIMVIGLGINVWLSLPGKATSPINLPMNASWSIAIDALRSPRIALIGAGPESYGVVYNLLKPTDMNMTESWNISFAQAANVPFTLLPTMGILGLVAWLVLVTQTIRVTKSTPVEGRPALGAIIVTLFLQLVFPGNVVTLALLIGAIIFWIVSQKESFSSIELRPLNVKLAPTKENEAARPEEYSQPFVYSVTAILLAAVVLVGYFASQSYLSYYYLFLSERAAVQNDIVSVYNYQQKAIQANPYLALIRRRYALTNLAIATALSNQEQPSEEDSQQVSQLVQQAIREGRAASTIDPTDTQNWRVLGDVYRNLIGVADGAESWAIASYSRAIETAPTDPTARVQLGGILFGQKEYQQAVTLFTQAAQLKQDYANAYYNLANAYKALENFVAAAQQYQNTLALLTADSEDYKTALAEFNEIKDRAQEQAAQLQAAQQQQQGQQGAGQPNASPSPSPSATPVNATQEQFAPQDQTLNPESNVNLQPGTEEQLNPGENQPQSPTPSPTPAP